MLDKDKVLEGFTAAALAAHKERQNYVVFKSDRTQEIGCMLISDLLEEYRSGNTGKTTLIEATPAHLDSFEGDAAAFIAWVDGVGAQEIYNEALGIGASNL